MLVVLNWRLCYYFELFVFYMICVVSVFECIDRANEAVKRLDSPNALTDKAYLFFSFQAEPQYNARKEKESVLFRKISSRLLEEQKLLEASSDNYAHLEQLEYDLIPEIEAYLKNNTPIFRAELDFILNELNLICNARGPAGYVVSKNVRLAKYESYPYKIADVVQGASAVGSSPGMCYGISSMMAIPDKSPYMRAIGIERPYVPITREIYEHQKNQMAEKADQKLIKKTQLTRKHFCPNTVKQAQEILSYAKAQSSKDLMLSLYAPGIAHACYLRVNITEDQQQEIWYMDPNHGAYRFTNAAEFIEFFTLSHEQCRYTRYQLIEMQYDPEGKLSRAQSFWDIWFFMLTGRHYQYGDGITGNLLFALYVGVSVVTTTLLSDAALTLGVLLFPPVGAFFFSLCTDILLMRALVFGYQGILGPIQYLEECCYQLGGFVNSLMGYSEKEELTKALDEALESPAFLMV